MRKFNWVLSTLLVSATIVSGLSTQLIQRAVAQTHPFQFKEATFGNLFNREKDNEPTAERRAIAAGQVWESIFGDFFNQPKDEKPTAGIPGGATGRGGICALTPRTIGTNTVVWSTRPLFAWRGVPPIQQIKVRVQGNQEALWDKKFSGRAFRVMYDGKQPLEPSQTYNWVILDDQNKEYSFTFKVLNTQERDRITVDLKKLEEELKNNKASDEEIALRRAEYFAQKQLWSDVLQEVYSVKNPSPALNQKIQALVGNICVNLTEQNSAQSR